MDTYLIKNGEQMQVEWDQAQYPQAWYLHPQYPHNQYLQQQYPQQRGVESLMVEEKEEDLVVEEAKLYVIILDNQNIFPGTMQVL